MNTDLRLCERDREPLAKIQQEICGGLLDDETIARAKKRFGDTHLGDRPVFTTPQVLLAMKMAVLHCGGLGKPQENESARYKIGAACLMINSLMIRDEERAALKEGSRDERTSALMIQLLGHYELVNGSALPHLSYRSWAMFKTLLGSERVTQRIRSNCGGFDFATEFRRIVGLSIEKWLALIFAFYAFLNAYRTDGASKPEHLIINRAIFRGPQAAFSQEDLNIVIDLLSTAPAEIKSALQGRSHTDLRYDFAPFKGRPLVGFDANRFFCTDLMFLMEKMHSGVYWAIFDGAHEKRAQLFQAWGILFEEYVNWFLSDRRFKTAILFFPRPAWEFGGDESFDGAFLEGGKFVPMEYKGGYLKVEARYSGDVDAFEDDLRRKIAPACAQLARKIETLFNVDENKRRRLAEIPLNHVTRVLPMVVVQDPILRGPFVNWKLNQMFLKELDRSKLRNDVTVEPLNLLQIHDLETMAESAEGGTFDIVSGLQLRCFRDPEMRSSFSQFMLTIPEYGKGKSDRIVRLMDEQDRERVQYLFGRTRPGEDE